MPRWCSPRQDRPWIAMPAWMVCLLLLQAALVVAQSPPTERQVKAAFLYNFARFVEWPPEVLANDERPFTICLAGADPPRAELEDIVAGKFLDRHPVKVKSIAHLDDAGACHILFITATGTTTTLHYLERLHGASILTVGESPNFCQLGGVLNFWMDSEHVRFEVSPKAAALARLRPSSKLLRLARIADPQLPGPTTGSK